MGIKAVCVAGVVPCTERAEMGEVYFALSLTKREIKHNKGVWRMPWH